MKTKNRVPVFLMAAGFTAAFIGIVYCLWLRGCFLPRDLIWDHAAVEGIPGEVTALLPRGSLVQDAVSEDINGDGHKEWLLLVWKRGSYGQHRPSWVKENDRRLSQHVFIYGLTGSRREPAGAASPEDAAWHPLWMSSDIGRRVVSMEACLSEGSGARPLLVLTDSEGKTTRWGWLTFGLVLMDGE